MSAAYKEYSPHPGLAPHVECFWTIRGVIPPGASLRNRVLPDGCMDIIFDVTGGTSWIIGPMSQALDVRLTGVTDLLGIRFHTGRLPALIRHPAHELLDERVELRALWSAAVVPSQDVLLTRPSGEARIQILEEMLLRHLTDAQSPPVLHAVAALQRSHGARQICDVLEEVAVGRRQLERLFAEHVGLSPKQTARVIRFRRAVETLHDAPRLHWAQLAAGCGYYDQAHFIRDFRELAGVTPERYRAEREMEANVAFVQS